MTIEALPTRVIAKQLTSRSMIGSLYIPKDARRKTAMALVLSVGPDITNLVPGDIIHIDGIEGRPFTHNDEDLLDIDASTILAKLIDKGASK